MTDKEKIKEFTTFYLYLPDHFVSTMLFSFIYTQKIREFKMGNISRK